MSDCTACAMGVPFFNAGCPDCEARALASLDDINWRGQVAVVNSVDEALALVSEDGE